MKKVSFLTILALFAFQLNAQTFKTNEGTIKFINKTSLMEFEAVNNQVTAAISGKGKVQFRVPINSFQFEKKLMQSHFQENYMESQTFPNATFSGSVMKMDGVNLTKAGEYNVKVAGKFDMHGVSKADTLAGKLIVAKGTVKLVSSFSIKCNDYNIKIPAAVSSKVANEIKINVNCLTAITEKK
jgi:polyisoprenoid-binding protein YceI